MPAGKANTSFESFFQALQQSDPLLGAELQETLDAAVSYESTDGGSPHFLPETIVLTRGRPVLDIKSGETVIMIEEVESQIWKDRLIDANRLLAPNIPAVGRIELSNHPRGVQWVGTGWLIRDNIIVTNRHVAELFGEHNGEGFVFSQGFDGSSMKVDIDFIEEFDNRSSLTVPLFRIVHIEKRSGPDLAFLRIEPVAGHDLPKPVTLSSAPAAQGDQIAVIGYPARDPYFPDPAEMDRIFNHRYEKKRLAPGMVTGLASERVFHDCSTLGGNSGGEVVSLKTGHAVALHFAGTLFTKNHAVPIDVVASRLDDALRGRLTAGGTSSTAHQAEDPKPQFTAQSNGGSRRLEVTIPVKISVDIGDIVSPSAVTAGAGVSPHANPVDLDADDDLIERVEARPEDYRSRRGYDPQFLGADAIVPLPTITTDVEDVLTYQVNGEPRSVLDYEHFSVIMSVSRRLCRLSACNIDGESSKRTTRSGWQFDPRIPKSAQILKECYGNPPKFSRGHMTRREDPAWGSDTAAHRGSTDSMHVTNAVPQMQSFNAPIWLDLEDYALQNARKDDMRISVFTGPFLAKNDPIRFGVKIPVTFWKVIAFVHDQTGKLCATGYTMSQKSFLTEEEFVFGRHENNQRPIAEIEQRAGISFGPLAKLDPLKDMSESALSRLTHPEQIRFV